MMGRIQELITKDLKNDTEREALVKLVIAKSQEQNQMLIEEQRVMIESLESKTNMLEQDLKTMTANESSKVQPVKLPKTAIFNS